MTFCISLPLYYCSNANEVVEHTMRHGEVAGMKFWLHSMEQNMNREPEVYVEVAGSHAKQTVREALRQRHAAMSNFAQQLFPSEVLSPRTPGTCDLLSRMLIFVSLLGPCSNIYCIALRLSVGLSLPPFTLPFYLRHTETVLLAPLSFAVLYPFSGLDALSAMALFPNASTFVLLANLKHGIGLACFRQPFCVKMASRSAYKVVQNWARHHLAWLETSRMQMLFDHQTGSLPTLLLLLHLGGHDFESLHPLIQPEPDARSGDDFQNAMASAVTRSSPYYAPLLNGTVVRLHRLNGSIVRTGRVRCIFVSVTLRDDEAVHSLLHRQHVLSGELRQHSPRYATLLKAAPDEITSLPWFQRWVLGRSVALLQDETGVPIPALLTAGRDDATTTTELLADAALGDSGGGGGGGGGNYSKGSVSSLVRSTLASSTRGAAGSTWLRGTSWAIGAYGNFTRLQMARRFWGIAELKPRTKSDETAMRGSFAGPELPFAFGYGAYPEECQRVASQLKRPLGDDGALPCNGILLAAFRRSRGVRLERK